MFWAVTLIKIYILIIDKRPIQKLDDTKLTPEPLFNYFFKIRKKFCLRSHYNGSYSFLFVNAAKMYQFQGKESEIKMFGKYFKGFHS